MAEDLPFKKEVYNVAITIKNQKEAKNKEADKKALKAHQAIVDKAYQDLGRKFYHWLLNTDSAIYRALVDD